MVVSIAVEGEKHEDESVVNIHGSEIHIHIAGQHKRAESQRSLVTKVGQLWFYAVCKKHRCKTIWPTVLKKEIVVSP